VSQEPIHRGDAWWTQQADGTWLRCPWTPPRGSYKSLTPLWKVVVGFLIAAIAVDALAALSDVMVLLLLDRIGEGDFVTVEEIDSTFAVQALGGLFQLVALLVTGILFIIWLYRATQNLTALGAGKLRYGPGWAIGAWFIPIFSLWGPKQVINDAWRASDPDLPAWHGDAWRGKPVPWWWMLWWLAFLISGFLVIPSIGITERSSLGEVQAAEGSVFAADLLSVMAGILAIFVVRTLSQRQMDRASRLGVGHPAVGLPSGAFPEPGSS
jgi:hypothetical protein